ncbi:MAG: class I SAM-dependent methyltransferase [Candidatus Saganbacteria bacterium]|nr:class I SAM-dependent methyltransferase [Candidatus Saganbacteria bacterium]
MTDKRKQIEYFEGLLAKHGENFLALDWNSNESQKLRYQVFREIFIYAQKAANISVLDVGCGFGDLYGFFKSEKMLGRQKIRYTGYDISEKLLEVARKKYPEARFELKDILEDRHVPKFDYILASGIFNIRTTDSGSHIEFVKAMLLRMSDLAKHGVAANFLSEGALPISVPEDVNSGRYYYFKPEEIMSFCRFISSRFIIRHDYHPGDFTVYLLK